MDTSGTVLAGSSHENNYGYTGRYLDIETGLWYFRARYFSDELGRFINRDPLGYVDGMSLYNGYFAEGFGLDPTGLYEDSICCMEECMSFGRSYEECIKVCHPKEKPKPPKNCVCIHDKPKKPDFEFIEHFDWINMRQQKNWIKKDIKVDGVCSVGCTNALKDCTVTYTFSMSKMIQGAIPRQGQFFYKMDWIVINTKSIGCNK
jgi:RHS repeat-associated protein